MASSPGPAAGRWKGEGKEEGVRTSWCAVSLLTFCLKGRYISVADEEGESPVEVSKFLHLQ